VALYLRNKLGVIITGGVGQDFKRTRRRARVSLTMIHVHEQSVAVAVGSTLRRRHGRRDGSMEDRDQAAGPALTHRRSVRLRPRPLGV
jgi:hypothetical protein